MKLVSADPDGETLSASLLDSLSVGSDHCSVTSEPSENVFFKVVLLSIVPSDLVFFVVVVIVETIEGFPDSSEGQEEDEAMVDDHDLFEVVASSISLLPNCSLSFSAFKLVGLSSE